MKQAIKLNGTKIKTPHAFKIERYNITSSSRVASGLMMMELIAKKRKFYFTYNAITSTDMKAILAILWEGNDVFFTLEYIEDNIKKTATVYVGNLPTELSRTDEAEWVWQDVTFNLIEQ